MDFRNEELGRVVTGQNLQDARRTENYRTIQAEVQETRRVSAEHRVETHAVNQQIVKILTERSGAEARELDFRGGLKTMYDEILDLRKEVEETPPRAATKPVSVPHIHNNRLTLIQQRVN